jgi:hypothetical protein
MLIPASVAAYVHDGGIRRAANEMLRIPDDGILEGLDWSELARFYGARLAARQLECEWAIFGLSAWDAVWAGLLDHWTPLSPDEQTSGDYDAGLDLTSLKDTDDESLWFGRIFTKGVWTFYASLFAIPKVGLRIKVACESGEDVVDFTKIAPAADQFGNWMADATARLDVDALDQTALRTAATLAVEIADARCAMRRRRSKT